MAKRNYRELLLDPKWQKMRLLLLDGAGWKCELCGDSTETLHVHHSYYESGLKPWEYPRKSLHVLCQNCHFKEQDEMVLLHRQIGRLGLGDIAQLLGYACAMETLYEPGRAICVETFECATGVADAYHVNPSDVMHATPGGLFRAAALRKSMRSRAHHHQSK